MERFISIMGWSKHHKQMDLNPKIDESAKGPKNFESGYAVYRTHADGSTEHFKIDMEEPITLKRCAEILSDAEKMTGNTYSKITIEDNKYNGVNPIIHKKYIYSKANNRLTIWQGKSISDSMPVYENWDGQICKDEIALADCLC